MNPRSLGALAFWALVALQPAWHLWLAPPARISGTLATAIMLAPLLPPAIALLLRRPTALFWAAVVALLHFSHGVSELWADPAARLPAAAQVALATLLVLAVGRDGWLRRRAARAGAT